MADHLNRDTVFLALTRPQMFAGVTYNFFVSNAVLAVEFFLVFRSFWALVIAGGIHLAGVVLCFREVRFFDLWITRASRCPRVKNYAVWGCNSYRP